MPISAPRQDACRVLLLADHFEAAQTEYEAAADRCC
jgi:hypothetical protein